MTLLRANDGRSTLTLPAGTCKVCSKDFIKFNSMAIVCGAACGLKYARTARVTATNTIKAEKRAEVASLKARKEAIKTRSDWIKDAQHAFNAFIRARDAGKPCICCGVPLGPARVGGAFDCGHYRSVGSAPHLRFDERNAHGQTKQCNRYGAGRAVDYRIGLIQRIGREAVEELESDNSSPKFTIDELKAIRDDYRARTRMLLKERE